MPSPEEWQGIVRGTPPHCSAAPSNSGFGITTGTGMGVENTVAEKKTRDT